MKARDKKRLIIVGVLLVVLAVLCAGYYALAKYSKEKESEEESAGKEVLSTVEEADISEIAIQNENGDFVFKKGSDDTWKYPEDTSVSLDQDVMESITSGCAEIVSTQIAVDETDDLSQFGLENPAKTLTITLKDGTAVTLRLGNTVPGIGGYYGQIEGNKGVYVFDETTYSFLSYSLEDVTIDESDSSDTSASDSEEE